MNTIRKLITAVLASAGLAVTSYAGAVLEIWTDNVSATFVYDNASGDSNGNIGSINWNGTVDGWDISVVGGKTVFGGTSPAVDLVALVTSSGNGGTLRMFYGDNNFGPTSNASVIGTIGGTTNGGNGTSVFFGAGFNDQNISEWGAWNGTTTVGGNPFWGGFNESLADSTLYSLQVQVEVTHRGAATTSFDAYVGVPDTASTALLISLGLMGVGVAARRNRRAQV